MVHLLINPSAARGKAGRRLPAIRHAMDVHGISWSELYSEYPDHAVELLARLDGDAHMIIAVGGDGTVNQLVNAASGRDLVLGAIPAGTGNDFAHFLGMRTIADVIDAIQAGSVRAFDVAEAVITDARGTVKTRRFINTMGCGFDAAVGLRASRMNIGGGILPYLLAVFRELAVWDSAQARLHIGEDVCEFPLFLACFGNGTTSGGGFMLTPNACEDDGMLDLCAVRDLPRRRVLRVLPKALSGAHLGEPEVLTGRAGRFRLELSRPMPVHLDGEITSDCAVDISIRVLPRAARVLVSRKQEARPRGRA